MPRCIPGLLTGAMSKERVPTSSGDFRRNAKNYQEPLLSRNLAVADFIGRMAERHGVSAGVVAIAWTLHHPAITAAIVGGRNARQVEGVIPAATFRLSDKEFSEIQKLSRSARDLSREIMELWRRGRTLDTLQGELCCAAVFSADDPVVAGAETCSDLATRVSIQLRPNPG